MWSILKGEWHKLRRCQILLVGIVALTLCPQAICQCNLGKHTDIPANLTCYDRRLAD